MKARKKKPLKRGKKPARRARPPNWHVVSFDGERIPYLDKVRLKGVKSYQVTVEPEGTASMTLELYVRMSRKR